MKQSGESPKAKIARLERELRVYREREQDVSERESGPADIVGIAGRPAGVIMRDQNMPEVRRFVDQIPEIPSWHDEHGQELGTVGACDLIQSELTKLIAALYVGGPYTVAQVRDRHRLDMYVVNRAKFMLRTDRIGAKLRADLLRMIVKVVFTPSVSRLVELSSETPVEPTEAPRRDFKK